jgi:hypothetical protein
MAALSASTRWRRSRRSGRDNRGVMIRVMGDPGDPATIWKTEPEPLANPYLYMAANSCGARRHRAQARSWTVR